MCKGGHLLSPVEWDISMFDHMSNLPLHCEEEKEKPVKEQNGPKHRNVEHGEEGQEEGNTKSFCYGIPEKINKLFN